MPGTSLRLSLALLAASVIAAAAPAATPPAPVPPSKAEAAAEPVPEPSPAEKSPAPMASEPDVSADSPNEEAPADAPTDGEPAPPEPPPEPEADLYDLGQQLFEAFAPEEIKERYRYPTREEWDDFAIRLDRALQSHSLEGLAAMEPDARGALAALRALPTYSEYADWLEERLDDITVARQAAAATSAASSPRPPATPGGPAAGPAPASEAVVPLYDLWLERMRRRPPPVRAANLVPRLKATFNEAAVPSALVWVAEVESSFNPAARSPVGARGLFQLMPGTAKDLGLRLFPFDERLDPMKNASSAARYLHQLHRRFQDWPLALAAYNAGPARVSRTLAKHEATTFAEIAEVLPAETRLYVPKVLATIAVREGAALAGSRGAGAFRRQEPPPRRLAQSEPLP